ncbi:ABC transporter permease [Bacillus cereus]|uniref:ABC transporter permease n=1 Tax=Bacillus cereus TaxID=1396 RepID=UPI001E5DA550|nr:ABC transporter permease [Bacillus cereus]
MLSVYVIIFSLMLSLTTIYLIKINSIDKITNNFYSKNSVDFHIKNDNRPLDMQNFLNQIDERDFILFKENVLELPYIKGIFRSGDIEAPPLVSGRFFQTDDFFKNKNIAVVGKSNNDIILKNGKRYIQLNNTKFEIIGIMGEDFPTKLDTMIFLNLDAVLKLENKNYGSYVLDGKKDMTSTFDRLEQDMGPSISIVKADKETTGSSRIFERNRGDYGIIILFILVILSMSIVIVSYWFYKKRISISIQHVIGHRMLHIYMNLLKKHVLLLLIPYFFSIFMFIIFNLENIETHLDKYMYSLGLGISFLCVYHFLLCILAMCIYSSKIRLKVLK